MQQCSPLARIKLPTQLHPHLRITSTNHPRCTLSTNSTSLHVGPTSSHSISHTTLFNSQALHSRPLSTSRLSSRSSDSSLLQLFLQCTRRYSSKRWQARQSTDPYTRLAKVQDLKSRAAFKLLQINDRYRLLRPGHTVVDLGFAPGSWSQVAIDLVKPGGRVLGVDLIPAQPPKGVSAIQGDFTSADVRDEVRRFVSEASKGKLRPPVYANIQEGDTIVSQEEGGYLELERTSREQEREHDDKCVDVVLSDMCEPWDLIEGHHKRTLSNPYRRMMNTSGNAFRDHVGSMVRILFLRVVLQRMQLYSESPSILRSS